MGYDWNIRKWIEQMLPFFFRKVWLIAFIYSMLAPLQALFDDFIAYKKTIEQKLKYNSQQIVLTNLLNNIFDNSSRRIRIETSNDKLTNEYDYLIDDAGADTGFDFMIVDGVDAEYSYMLADYVSDIDFTVYVPISLSASEAQIKARIDFYLLASKKYSINYI